VQHTVALFAPVCQRQKANVGYFRRDECQCNNCMAALKEETLEAEEDFQAWQLEEQQEIADSITDVLQGHDTFDGYDALEGHEWEGYEWEGTAMYNDYETTASLFD